MTRFINLNGYDELGAIVGGHELRARLVLDMDLDLSTSKLPSKA
jgi:hypothetical protein